MDLGQSIDSEEYTEYVNRVEQCVKQVRTVSYLLHLPMLEKMGLESATPWYLEVSRKGAASNELPGSEKPISGFKSFEVRECRTPYRRCASDRAIYFLLPPSSSYSLT